MWKGKYKWDNGKCKSLLSVTPLILSLRSLDQKRYPTSKESIIIGCRKLKLKDNLGLAPYCVCSVTHSGLTLCNPMDFSPPGSSVHGILQARILGWVAISSFKGYSRPRDRTWVSSISCTGRKIHYHCTSWKAPAPY